MATSKQAEEEVRGDDRGLLLATNHRYFVRQAVSSVCELMLVSLVYAFFIGVCLALVDPFSSNSSSMAAVFIVFASLVYLAVVVIVLARIISLHAKVTSVEDVCIFTIDDEEWKSVHQTMNS